MASALVGWARTVKRLGATVIITAIPAEVVQTLVHLGADLSAIVPRGTLQSGIAYALESYNPPITVSTVWSARLGISASIPCT